MARDEGSVLEGLRRMGAEMVLEAASLTDELTDEEARPVINWSLLQAEAAADVATDAVGMDPAREPGEAARADLMERIAPVRSLIRAINALAGERRDLDSRQVFDRLDAIRSLAKELPVPGGEAVTDVALAELTAWQTGFDNGAFAWAIVYLLQGMPIGEAVITWWTWETRSSYG